MTASSPKGRVGLTDDHGSLGSQEGTMECESLALSGCVAQRM